MFRPQNRGVIKHKIGPLIRDSFQDLHRSVNGNMQVKGNKQVLVLLNRRGRHRFAKFREFRGPKSDRSAICASRISSFSFSAWEAEAICSRNSSRSFWRSSAAWSFSYRSGAIWEHSGDIWKPLRSLEII